MGGLFLGWFTSTAAGAIGSAGALLVLILAVVQLPTILILGPIIVYVFSTSSTVTAVVFAIWSILVGISDAFLKPLLMGRGVDVPMLVIFIGAIGGLILHGLIGLFVGAVKMFSKDKRHAVGKGMAGLMVVLIALALMAAAGMLPERFFTPLVITTLVALPVLVIAEGVLAPVELVSTLGNVLSYARIMAVGTASVMMAVVANRMTNAFGGVVVGVICALLFHLVNFVLGVFSPTIHMLRLHYVEFFGKFFSPGGAQYQPFRHWSARESASDERSK